MAISEEKKMDGHCLKLEGLTKAFAGLVAVDHVNLTVGFGERRAIIGPNGAGKTTLFNLISGELKTTEGRIIFWDKEVTNASAHRRANMGIARTFQITNLFPNLTVIENLLLACQALERTKFGMLRAQSSYQHLVERSEKLLRDFDLLKERGELIRNLSHGDQRKIEVAMAMAGKPRLLLLDEPTAGLSSAETLSLTHKLKDLDREMTVLLIEHDMDVAFEFCDNITVLQFGAVLAEGTKEEVQNNREVQQIYLGEG